MDYYRLKLTIIPNTETHRDVLAALLADCGFESFVESENGLDAFVPEKLYSETTIAEILENYPLPHTLIRQEVEWIKSQNWNEEWEKNFFQPVVIDNQIVVHSSFHKNIPSAQYEIVIDPKMAFGTGHHATTCLMLSYLLELEVKNRSFLDMGCGTAVLAILAKIKGADPVVAMDIDSYACENSLENIRLNHVDDIQIRQGDASVLGKERYDFIFANINRNILLNDIQIYASCMQEGSSLLMSGFYREDCNLIEEECKKYQLEYISDKEKDHWNALHFRKGSPS
ncbi:MAG: 50S ribosomal protein L11 methyltransferase [Candidatus Azobacteroides sp.]|nr:50S ribosomal protein L11 methyltransferase [Candidatus Azobacteroides sp.]